jgi:hypothetical protein
MALAVVNGVSDIIYRFHSGEFNKTCSCSTNIPGWLWCVYICARCLETSPALFTHRERILIWAHTANLHVVSLLGCYYIFLIYIPLLDQFQLQPQVASQPASERERVHAKLAK